MENPRWNNRTSDDLTGSPELFASNLLLVRAMDQKLEEIEITRHDGAVGVKLFSSDRKYDEETLTEQPEKWNKIVERFEAMTDFEGNEKGSLEPSLPLPESVKEITARYEDNQITISFQYR